MGQNYKDGNNKIHFLDDEAFAYMLPDDCIPITQDEADALRAPSLSEVKESQCALMEAAYVSSIGAPISYMGTSFEADDYSRTVLNETLTAAGGTLPDGFQWYDVNNNGISMSYAQLQGLAASILMRGQPLFVKKRTKKDAINVANSVDAVMAVVW